MWYKFGESEYFQTENLEWQPTKDSGVNDSDYDIVV